MGQIYGGSAALSCKYLKHVKTLKHSQPVQAAYGQSSTVTSPRSDLKDDVLAAITLPPFPFVLGDIVPHFVRW